MTHTTTIEHRDTFGSLHVVVVTYDITSLDSAGTETITPDADAGLSQLLGAKVVGQEEGGRLVTYDHVNADQFHVKRADYDATADGVLIDEANNADIGEVRVVLFGLD